MDQQSRQATASAAAAAGIFLDNNLDNASNFFREFCVESAFFGIMS